MRSGTGSGVGSGSGSGGGRRRWRRRRSGPFLELALLLRKLRLTIVERPLPSGELRAPRLGLLVARRRLSYALGQLALAGRDGLQALLEQALPLL